MKRDQKIKHAWYAVVTLTVFVTVTLSCHKSSPLHPESDTQSQQDQAKSSPETPDRLQYKDSVLFYKDSPKSYIVKPKKVPGLPGYFVSGVEGLQINASTGAIDVNNSESGLRYTIYYMSPANEPIDSAIVSIAGIDYADGIFEIDGSPSHEQALPVYHGTTAALPCSGDSSGSIACVFDETDLDGNGTRDIPGANRGKLHVNKKTGVIDLERSLTDGLFGANPVDGASKDFNIYYRLNDASAKAINKIKVRVYHFKTRDNIPSSLIEELRMRKEGTENATAPAANGDFIQSNILSILKPKRPPLIIIVSGYSAL